MTRHGEPLRSSSILTFEPQLPLKVSGLMEILYVFVMVILKK